MEEMYLYWEPWVLMGVVLCVTLLMSKIIWVGRGSNRNPNISLPPGSTGWPLIGEMISFNRALKSGRPRQFAQDHEKRYGQIFRSNLFGRSRIIVSVDPKFNKYVLQNEGRLFQANYPSSIRNLLGKYGILTVHGELHRKLHGTAANLLKRENLISGFRDDIQNAIVVAMQRWQQKSVIHLHKECNNVLLNIMGKQLLDLPPYEEMEEMYKAFEAFVAAMFRIPIKFPGTHYARGIKGRETLIRKIKECIEERRQHPEVIRNDLLTKLLKEESLPDEIIADFIIAVMFASYETTSTAIAFSIKFLTDCPQALKELRDEHDSLLKDNGNKKMTWENYQSMKFTHCVIKETLRLGNVALGLFRDTKQDVKFKDFVIPKGWTIFLLVSSINRDEKYYHEPFTFNPWRWQNEPSLELSDNPWYMPFGGGARLCPGYYLARFEMALFLHNFVTMFRWEPAEDDKICYFPMLSFEKGFPIRLYACK